MGICICVLKVQVAMGDLYINMGQHPDFNFPSDFRLFNSTGENNFYLDMNFIYLI